MSAGCASLVGGGVIQGVLGAVDCETRVFAQTGYSALTSASSGFQVALTALLTIYVALVGYRMLFASNGARLSDAPGIALRIGAILALVTSWATFQTLVFDLAAEAPGQIAAIVAAPLQSDKSSLAADPAGGLQIAYDQITRSAVAFGRMAGPDAKAYSSPNAAAAEALSTASGVLFLTTAGLIAAATLSIGVLTAVGPLFIATLLIPMTRGLFVGWVRALGAAALTLLLGWLGIVLLLSVLEPWLIMLVQELQNVRPEPQTATTTAALVFVFGVGQFGLLIGACVTAFGFRIPQPKPEVAGQGATAAGADGLRPEGVTSRAQRLAFDLQREPAAMATHSRSHQISAASSSGAARAAPAYGASGPTRLGDSYRRPSTQSRRLRIRR
jgi:type IV secretion system protein VirB6